MTRRTNGLLALCLAAGINMAYASPLPDYPFVSTSGKAQAWLRPDIGELDFQANALDPSAPAAAAKLDQLATAVIGILTEHGVADSDIDRYDISKKSLELSKPADDGTAQTYALARHFHVHVRQLEAWPAIVAALVALDGIDSIGTGFDCTSRAEVNRRLAGEAAQDARANGAQLAEAFGRRLGPAVAISKGSFDKLAAPFALASGGADSAPRAPAEANYAVPAALPFVQSVNVIFKLTPVK